MNVLLISQCTKRALTETRRILDQFAERRGDRTWQTPITQQGLDALRQLLKKTARRNTAVACHWIRGQDHSELMWVVGDASQFNELGAVPTNTTTRNILRQTDENDWHTAEDIRLLSAMAALFHDFGKASVLFQRKLEGNAKVADPYRHEWVSLRLFQALVGSDDDRGWLTRLAGMVEMTDAQWKERLYKDGVSTTGGNSAPLGKLPALARAVGWLVVSHHRLPQIPPQQAKQINAKLFDKLLTVIDANWCGSSLTRDAASVKACWTFKLHLPDASQAWRKRAAELAQRMLARPAFVERDWLASNPYAMHVARMGLMLADHHYSSGPRNEKLGDPSYMAHANTGPDGQLKQRLDEHLIGVEKGAQGIIHSLPRLQATLPHIARHKGFKRRSSEERFRWQDKAFDLATGLQARAAQQGFFGVNMASTGCGKTLANGRIMYALADPLRGARFTIALGLRTLTLQTGEALSSRLGLDSDDLAVLVGGRAVRQLYEHQQKLKAVAGGSESAEELLPDNTHVHFEGAVVPGPLSEWLASKQQRGDSANKLLNAPVVVCTVDHLMPACESTRGGHQISPMLRLLTSDLVLDEPDDFGPEDLYALTRLVHMAGLLGSRVLLSSATLPPALLQGLFAAYLAGRRIFQNNRGVPGLPLNVCCAWFDENRVTDSAHADEASFAQAHTEFVQKRLAYLRTVQADDLRRRARIVAWSAPSAKPEDTRPALAQVLLRESLALHADSQNHSTDPSTGKGVSFGLIRMANIDPLIDVARALLALTAPPGVRIHLCVYHSRHPLLVRSAIEAKLDRLLQRGQPEAVFKDAEIRGLLDGDPATDHLFIVLATSVLEVGRDFDADWAIVEPSSMRAIIQLAGRVRRHRASWVARPNMVLLDTNLRALENPGRPAFQRPGFESKNFPLTSHSLTQLLRPAEADAIDAAPRIMAHQLLEPRTSLVDLEHECLAAMMVDGDGSLVDPVRRWWQTLSHYTAIEQKRTRFRRDDQGREPFVLLPDDGDDFCFWLVNDDGIPATPVDKRFTCMKLPHGDGILPWGGSNYLEELAALADSRDMKLEDCARQFGTIDLPKSENEQGWLYHPLLGFRRR
ncbi:type I-F CRISPR-associated helicase Cas3f [Polaromonas sp.]|uniref:type I-F CRISPR-associated helicase Cas3f n=1 Tax=Polaromonas sp. TaxID=1869339 RepID=UPI00286C9CF2|nr:type I-F CRISPR-associated helicase Cas3f [Polaromonas sp.]